MTPHSTWPIFTLVVLILLPNVHRFYAQLRRPFRLCSTDLSWSALSLVKMYKPISTVGPPCTYVFRSTAPKYWLARQQRWKGYSKIFEDHCYLRISDHLYSLVHLYIANGFELLGIWIKVISPKSQLIECHRPRPTIPLRYHDNLEDTRD